MFLQQLINGLILGGAYALISVGLTMSFGIMKISNFAHGTIYMLGGYACYFFGQRLGLPFFVSVALAMEVLVGTGSVRETIKRPQGNPPLKELMEQGNSLYGMQTFEMSIKQLVRDGLIEREAARAYLGF